MGCYYSLWGWVEFFAYRELEKYFLTTPEEFSEHIQCFAVSFTVIARYIMKVVVFQHRLLYIVGENHRSGWKCHLQQSQVV
jgi:hypothetical protein